ncbi:MAG: hypothetical protein KG075_16660 [Alphaproteobacteria bacterium]|nr:hypothetical protein [Alphaproteobacteria bacterium]
MSTKSSDILNYNDLVARYETDLIENLRGFGFQTDYLDLWVPDEDLSRSLLNLLDAAATAGRDTLTVRLPASHAAQLRQSDFLSQAQTRCTCRQNEDGADIILQFTNVRLPDAGHHVAVSATTSASTIQAEESRRTKTVRAPLQQPKEIARLYAQALYVLPGASASPALDTAQAGVAVKATCDGLTLEAAISPDHVVTAMAYSGARTPVSQRLAQTMLRLFIGLPILEIAGHGAIRVEYHLRDHGTPPVPGIAIPEATEPAFALVIHLARELLSDYRQKTGYSEHRNLFDTPPGPTWMKASEAERRQMLSDAFAKDGIPPQVVSIIAIEYDVRVVISLDGDLARNPADHMLRLERSIKRHVDSRLELFLAEVKDHNKIRRLSESGA